MTDKHKIDIDELMTLYLDGQATQRQQTELKRLMQHDPAIAETVAALQRQQQLLRALPMETAPDGLIDAVRAELERTLILGDSAAAATAAGTSGLLLRRLLTTAAMLLIPLGLLSVVVYQIVKPPSTHPVDYVSVADRMAETVAPVARVADAGTAPIEAARKMPFNGLLILETDEYMTVSGAVEKAIFAQGLIGRTLPNRTADVTSFHITASPREVADLMDAMDGVWRRCKRVNLNVVDDAGETVTIADPRSRQIKTLVYEDSAEMLNHLATRYAAANLKDTTAPVLAAAERPAPAISDDGYPAPSIPTLAGSYDAIENATIDLSIHIERNIR